MFKHKKHLFFDLDHTLWDFDYNSSETLSELWNRFELNRLEIQLEPFLVNFKTINEAMWEKLNIGLIDKDEIRHQRFPTVLKSFNVVDHTLANEIASEYINICPTKPHLIDGALDLLNNIKDNYELFIITNGFDEIQDTKLNSGGIKHFFKNIITSGAIGHKKPERQIFDHALEVAGAQLETSLMIGDNPIADIQGAHAIGLEQVFYNPYKLRCPVTPTLEISSMRELQDCL
jgi:putative hydrolase of the HAD superfamily